jgi:hypothetical protein
VSGDEYGLRIASDPVANRAVPQRTLTAPQRAPSLNQHSTHAELIEHYRWRSLAMAAGTSGGARVQAWAERVGCAFSIEGDDDQRVVWVLLNGATQRCRLELILAMQDGYLNFQQLTRADHGAINTQKECQHGMERLGR